MGYMRHNAIVVTSWDETRLTEAHGLARGIFADGMVSDVLPPVTNNYRSFLIAPDGSKEGWEESERGTVAREQFKKAMKRQRYAGYIDWAEIQYGDDEREAKLIDAGDFSQREE